jgi:heat shock protein HslJ
MRHTFLLITLVFTTSVFAQEPDPNLFQTWYLQSVFASDATPEPYIVSDIEPSINPTLTIQSDLTFTGMAACNSFMGSLLFVDDQALETSSLFTTLVLCGNEEYESFESEYFGFLQIMAFYSISSNENGMTLTVNTPIFGEAIYNNFPLSLTERTMSSLEVFPNPSNSVIHLKSENNSILGIEMFNLIGDRIDVSADNFETIDISGLSKGLYILKVATENGTVVERVIKE